TDRTLEVLRQRIDSLGVAEPVLTRSGEDRIIVELPDVQDPRQAAAVIGRTAQLSFHEVLGAAPPGTDPAPKPETGEKRLILPDEQGTQLDLGPSRLSGAGVKDASASFEAQQAAGWTVKLDFHKDAGKDWTKLTGEAACHPAGDERRRVA
ncbi:protein translocase subunit SecD, partial [Streptomyces cavourensis]|nr:protein translocase subunit SecD [Streptomyces cavourensis]